MHSSGIKRQAPVRRLSHLNFLFAGRRSHVYDATMVRLTRRLYQRVVEDMVPLNLVEGKVLDVGTGPGTLVRQIAHRFPRLQVYGLDLSEGMISLARQHAQREQIEERVHFDIGDVAKLPYADASFDLIVSTISMHHWHGLEQPLRELYRVLRSGANLWIYDGRFLGSELVRKALVSTPFAETSFDHQLVRTGAWPFALYRRFALQK